MKTILRSKDMRCFWLIFLCFLWTSSGYLSWLYHLMDLRSGVSVEMATEVIGYLFQALGLLLFVLMTRKHPKAGGRVFFGFAVGLAFLFLILANLSQNQTAVLGFGYGMNLFFGTIVGFYLHQLTLTVDGRHRASVFSFGYAAATIGAWLLSLPGEANFLRSDYALVVYGLLAGLTIVAASRPVPLDAEEVTDRADSSVFRLVILAAGTVFLLSLVKSLGFSFPSADIGAGINLELSRVFYAVGLVVAGIINDRERKYGAVCCVAALGVPFLMIALTGSTGTSIALWILNYLFFGFFSVYRVILFSDIARKYSGLLFLSGFGFLFGRLGDAAGSFGCIALSGRTTVLVSLTAVLFFITVLLFFLFYQRVYNPPPLPEKTEEERFYSFVQCYDLSPREQEVLRLVLEGRTNPEMADALFVTERTVKFHVHNLLKKTGCDNRSALTILYRTH